MSHAHSHNHAHESSRKRLKFALALTGLYMFAEAFGGWLTGSLALLADAGHMLTDVAALILTLTAFWFASRPANPRKTYGYYRLEILAAFVNGVALVLISAWIIYEAIGRLNEPPEVKSLPMIFVASGGLIINLICAWLLHSGHEHSLNLHGAWLHVLSDALGSVAAIIAGALMLAFGWYKADPICSFVIALVIIFGAWRLIRESVNILLEGTPAHINLAAVETAILETAGVSDVHDLHIWTITSGREALSAHIRHAEAVRQCDLLKTLRLKLHDRFGIDHLTIQMETPDFEDEPFHFCQ